MVSEPFLHTLTECFWTLPGSGVWFYLTNQDGLFFFSLVLITLRLVLDQISTLTLCGYSLSNRLKTKMS